METILLVIAIIAIIIESLVLAKTKRKLKAETTEANRLRTEMIRAQNNVILCEQKIDELEKYIKKLNEELREMDIDLNEYAQAARNDAKTICELRKQLSK